MNQSKKAQCRTFRYRQQMTPTRRPARDGERSCFSACPDSSGGRRRCLRVLEASGLRYVSTDNAYTAPKSRW